MATLLFNLILSGSGSVGAEVWLNLGLIPTGHDYRIGSDSFTAISKTTGFEIRTNLVGQSLGTTGATKVLATASCKTGTSITQDLYKKGALLTKTIVGTGVEKWWLCIYSSSATSGSYLYKVYYALE